MPSFDQPQLTAAVDEVVASTGVTIPDAPPLPPLSEPPQGPVSDPSDEPLVRVGHPRIVTVPVYRLAGWQHAIDTCWLRASVADALATVADALPDRFGLAVLDGWRPLALQAELHDAAYADHRLPPGFLAKPDPDPFRPPSHLSGGAVDLTLTIDGVPLALGTGFDAFTDASWTAALEAVPGPARDGRRFLFWSLRAAGFVFIDCEWWHAELGTRRWSAITGETARYGAIEPPRASAVARSD